MMSLAMCLEEKNRVILTVVASVFSLLLVYWRVKKLKDLPPGPRGLPLLGYIPFLGTDLHKEFTKLADVYGPIYKLWLGNKLCVVITSPELVKEVVRDNDAVFTNRDPTVSAKVATFGAEDIAFRDYGPDWKRLRKIFVRDVMGKTILESLYGLRKEQIKKSVKQIYGNVGRPIDLGNLTFVTARNTILSMMLGASIEEDKVSIDAKLKNCTGELMTLLGKTNISDVIPSLAWLDVQGVKKDTERVIRAVENLLDSVIQQRQHEMIQPKHNNGKSRIDFMQSLLELNKNQDAESAITLTQIKGLLLDNFLGGTDTTSGSVEWALAELLNRPETMKKAQEELIRVVGSNNEVEEYHLPQLTYLDAVFKESLRLHPALPLGGPRCAIQPTSIGGYKIPKGTKIFLNMWAIQRDPSIWENALEFRPERFLDSSNAGKFDLTGNNFSYLPFGSGRRVCPGIILAEKMSKLMIASFLHLFDWRLPDDTNIDLSDRFGIVAKIKNSVVAIPTPRFSTSQLYL